MTSSTAFRAAMPRLLAAFTPSYVLPALLVALGVLLLAVGRWIEAHRDALLSTAQVACRWVLNLPVLQFARRKFPGVMRFIGNRLSPEGYLGLHLTIGLLLSILAMGAFVEVADQMVDQEGLAEFDMRLNDALHAHATPGRVRLYKGISFLGSVPGMTALAIAVAVVLIVKRRRLLLAGWVVSLAGGGVLDELLKLAFRRPRPHFDEPFVTLHSWSFPSGHAMGSLVAYGMVAYIVLTMAVRSWRVKAVLIAVTAGLVLLIGFSRLYLGAHYLTDVIAGYAAGLVWLTACITGLEVARRRAATERRSKREKTA